MMTAYGAAGRYYIDGPMDIDYPVPCPPDRKAGLDFVRHLCDVLEDSPDLPNPLAFIHHRLWDWHHDDVLAVIREMRRRIGGTWEKNYDSSDFELKRRAGDTVMMLVASREYVCEKVVVGTREVVFEEYDPDLLAEVPKTTVIREEDVVEWRCPDVL